MFLYFSFLGQFFQFFILGKLEYKRTWSKFGVPCALLPGGPKSLGVPKFLMRTSDPIAYHARCRLRYHCTLSASPSDRYNVFGMQNLLTRNMHTTRSSVSCTSISFYIIFFTLPSSCFFVYALCKLHINHIFLS